MSRLTDNDRRFGPLTWGRAGWSPWRMVFSTGGGEEDHPRNNLTAYAFGHVFRVNLPTRLKPSRKWVDTSKYEWSSSRGGYWDVHSREYGFCLNEGHLSIYYGPQTGDSTTEKNWGCFLPWTQWRHIRRSMFDTNGKHFWTEWSRPRGFKFRDQWGAETAIKDACPTAVFEVEDYDGQRITAKTRIEEREWHFGTGWFKWLSIFRKPKLHRSLDIEFASEVGPEKGSWKGGLIGTSIETLPGELHEAAFRRYCDQEHRAKHGRYRIKFLGQAVSEKAPA